MESPSPAKPPFRYRSPLYIFIAIAVAAFTVEALIMFILDMTTLSPIVENLLDALILTTVLCATLFFLLYKPFSHDIKNIQETEKRLRSSEQRYRDLFENANDAIFLVDSNFRYLDVNKKAIELFGFSRKEFLSMTIMDVIPPAQKPISLKEFALLRKNGKYEKFIGKQRTKDGRWLDIEVSSSAIVENGKIIGSRDIVRDITQRQSMAVQLQNSQQILLTVLDSLDAIVYVADMQTYEILFLNRYAKNIFGEKEGRICWQTFQSEQNAPCEFCTNHLLLTEDGSPGDVYTWEFQNTVNNSWYDIRDRAVHWIDGRIVRLEIATDISNRKKMEQKLHEVSITDELTGLYNRRGFTDFANQQLLLADRMNDIIYLLYGDVDNLKWINDTHGHKEGDLALTIVATGLRTTFRKADIIGRMGGDEFVVMMTDKSAKENERTILTRLNENIQAARNEKNIDYPITMSTGIIRCKEQGPCSIETLLTEADALMYEQKKIKRFARFRQNESGEPD